MRAGREPFALQALADHLAQGRLMLEMAQIRTGFSLAFDLADRIAGRGWGLSASRTGVCPYITLAGHTWTSYLAGLAAAHRANLLRRIRNLGRTQDLTLGEARTEGLAGFLDLERDYGPDGDPSGFTQEELGECLLALGRPDEARPRLAAAYAILQHDASLQRDEPERLERLRRLTAPDAP